MGSYAQSAALYDLLYSGIKDYEAEAARLVETIGKAPIVVRRVLDVGCGTGRHAQVLARAGLAVDGLDNEPAFVRLAQERNPTGRFRVADMADFEVEEPYDAVLCLFGAIGYARHRDGMRSTIECLGAAVRDGGLVIVEPWFEPGGLQDGHVTVTSAVGDGMVVARVSRVRVSPETSRLEFEYLVGRPEGIEHWAEVHELGLFPRHEIEDAFRGAALDVAWDPQGLVGRGMYVASKRRTA
jgi:SAM-dependent methyltransferase